MSWTWLVDGEPVTAHDLGLVQTAESHTLTVELWWSQGEASAEPAEDVMIQSSTEDPTRPGVYLRTGLPPQDELWWFARVVGHTGATADYQSDWTPLGAYRALSIPIVEADTARLIELRCTPPGGSSDTTYRTRLSAAAETHAIPIPPTTVRGIQSGVGDPTATGLVTGADVTVTDPVSDTVDVSPGLYVFAGRTATRLGGSVALPDVDGLGQSVAQGESYWAGLSQGTGADLTVTAGAKGIEPERPTLPADEVFLRWIRAENVDGTIQLEADDIVGDPAMIRHPIRPGPGLELHVGPGRAVGAQTLRQWCRWDAVPLPVSTTSYLWQVSTGLWQLSETRPDGALGPWAAVTADATDVLTVVDLRSFVDPAVVLRWAGPPPAVGQSFEPITLHQALDLETLRLSADLATATTGALRLDLAVLKDGAWSSLFPSAVELQPAIQAGTSDDHQTFPEITALASGTRIRLTVIELPDTPPNTIELMATARPPEGGAVVELRAA